MPGTGFDYNKGMGAGKPYTTYFKYMHYSKYMDGGSSNSAD